MKYFSFTNRNDITVISLGGKLTQSQPTILDLSTPFTNELVNQNKTKTQRVILKEI